MPFIASVSEIEPNECVSLQSSLPGLTRQSMPNVGSLRIRRIISVEFKWWEAELAIRISTVT